MDRNEKIKMLDDSEEDNISGGYSGQYGVVIADKDDLKEFGVELKPYLVVKRDYWPSQKVISSYDTIEEALEYITNTENNQDSTGIVAIAEGKLKKCLHKRINGTYRLGLPCYDNGG